MDLEFFIDLESEGLWGEGRMSLDKSLKCNQWVKYFIFYFHCYYPKVRSLNSNLLLFVVYN